MFGISVQVKSRFQISDFISMIIFYFGGARNKGFATLRNLSKFTFETRLGTQSLWVFGFIRLFDEVRAELVRVISRSLRFL